MNGIGCVGHMRSPGRDDSVGTGITSIDHLSLAQPFDRFDEAGLFYRTVLGFVSSDDEFAAPFGLIRTLALRDPSHRTRLALSVPLLRRGDWAVRVEVEARCAATGETFELEGTLRAFEGERAAAVRRWQASVPRDGG